MNNENQWPGRIVLFIVFALSLFWLATRKAHGNEVIPLTINPAESTFIGAEFLIEGYKVEFVAPVMDGIVTLKLSLHYHRTPLGGQSRGERTISLGDIHFVEDVLTWQVPWLDTLTFSLKAKGYDSAGQQMVIIEKELSFVPAVIITAAEMLEEEKGVLVFGPRAAIIDLIRQRLYFLLNGVPEFAILVSKGRYHSEDRHGCPTPPGVYQVWFKQPRRKAKPRYHCWMPWCIKFSKDYNIHVTSSKFYSSLGKRPESHGCVRDHLIDGLKLYRVMEKDDWVIVVSGKEKKND